MVNCANCNDVVDLGSTKLRHVTTAEGDKFFCHDGCKVTWESQQEREAVKCAGCGRGILPSENKTLLTRSDSLPLVFCCPEHKEEYIAANMPVTNCRFCAVSVAKSITEKPAYYSTKFQRAFYFCNEDHKNQWLGMQPVDSDEYADYQISQTKKVRDTDHGHCYGCGRHIIITADTPSCIRNSDTANFCTDQCKKEWWHRCDRAEPRTGERREDGGRSMTDTPLDGNHYRRNGIEVYDIMDAWELDAYQATALMYILRANYKGTKRADTHKAINTLIRLRSNLDKHGKGNKTQN